MDQGGDGCGWRVSEIEAKAIILGLPMERHENPSDAEPEELDDDADEEDYATGCNLCRDTAYALNRITVVPQDLPDVVEHGFQHTGELQFHFCDSCYSRIKTPPTARFHKPERMIDL